MPWINDSPNRIKGRPWRRIRAQVLAEEPICRVCIERDMVTIASKSVVCGHILGLADGGGNERENLRGECKRHADEHTAEEGRRARGIIGPAVRLQLPIGADGWPIE
jgi:5-methylcytosine-specific restriction protein A